MKDSNLSKIAKRAILLLLLCSTAVGAWASREDGKTRVGVFEGHGGSQTCIWEAVEAVRIDPDMTVRTITTADIANGVLNELDAIIIPGGGGSTQYLNLGTENIQRLRKFIESGKGALGICAGAYLFSDTPDYACMRINGAKAIDIEHDNRGHGIAKFSLTKEGTKLFPELADRPFSYVVYYEGPVFTEADNSTIKYNTLAIMESDVHEEGNAPSNMTNNKPFLITNKLGKGRVASCIAHPEATPGMMWMIPRIIRWTLRMPIKAYKQRVVNPGIYNKEILMTKADLKKEKAYYETFLYGTPEEKVAALDWLQSCRSWDAKRWVQGLLFDGSPIVRIRAAKFIAETDYLTYMKDLEIAVKVEKDAKAKQEMERYLNNLKELIAK